MSKIGIMQGRLTEKAGFYPQQFPWKKWKQEFDLCRVYGAECIEWMFNTERYMENPIWTDSGVCEIQDKISATGIMVDSICANYFMQHTVYARDNVSVLKHLMNQAEKIKAHYIIVPLFEQSLLKDMDHENGAISCLKEAMTQSSAGQVILLIETDWKAERILQFLKKFDGYAPGVCYDLGNAVGNGLQPETELKILGHHVKNIHIKDKKVGGSSVYIGSGDVNFSRCLECLKDYRGNYILESYYEKAEQDTAAGLAYIRKLESGAAGTKVQSGKEQNYI